MRINGKTVDIKSMTLLEYLRQNAYNPGHVVVERNMEIITKERFGDVILMEGDDVNILKFMGGG